ncbi:hypothetical protein BASA83_010037 [Batrachochytrium salamandrivorans]|nr:hypothetical protein BASA81_011399 [Batrachochytrium salamandrivorans]KAH9267303.1 hypothetical protein BASA83_010037 [Batrachochytrium salamandrivorans]
MRLSSFAMVSLLAITVSAQPPHNTDTDAMDQFQDSGTQMLEDFLDATTQNSQQSLGATSQDLEQSLGATSQDLEQSLGATSQDLEQALSATSQDLEQYLDAATQDIREFQGISAQEVDEVLDATTQSAQQSNQDKVLAEMDRLTKAHNAQIHYLSQIDSYINIEKQRDKEVRDIIDRTAIKLQETSISSDERLGLQQTIYDLKMVADQLTTVYKGQTWPYEDAMTKRRDANAALQLLNDNQKMIAAYNSQHGIQVELSPNTYYNMGILTAQYDKVLKDIETLLAEQKTIDNLVLSSNDDALKAKSAQLENEIHDLRSYSKIAREILWEHKYNLPLGTWISESLNSYLWNAKI